jgi:hypothetical protein
MQVNSLITDDLKNLPPLYSQDKLGESAIVWAKFSSRVLG